MWLRSWWTVTGALSILGFAFAPGYGRPEPAVQAKKTLGGPTLEFTRVAALRQPAAGEQDPAKDRQVEELKAKAKEVEAQVKALAAQLRALEAQARALQGTDAEHKSILAASEKALKALQDAQSTQARALEEARYQLMRNAPGGSWSPVLRREVLAFMTPEMARKTSSIMALRAIVQMGLTAKDIQATLPILTELQGAEKALQAEADRVLDEEKRALLSAKPGSLPAEDTGGQKLQEASNRYRERQQESWKSVAGAIGQEKAIALQRLVQGGTSVVRVYSRTTGVAGYGTARPVPRDAAPMIPNPMGGAASPFSFDFDGPGRATIAGGSISLSELIDLLKQRRDAMKE
jgi:hypothetical protein